MGIEVVTDHDAVPSPRKDVGSPQSYIHAFIYFYEKGHGPHVSIKISRWGRVGFTALLHHMGKFNYSRVCTVAHGY